MKNLREDEFWALVEEVGWPEVAIDAAKLSLMRRYDSETMESFRRVFHRKSNELARAAAMDWCCDSWDDTRAHIIGLGRAEFERNLSNPALMREREENGDYRESFVYCIPFVEDYGLLTDEGYARRLREVRGFVDSLDAADPDDVPPRLYRRFDQARQVCTLLLDQNWTAAVTAYHAAYGEGYTSDWPFSDWCGYLVPNMVHDLERYRLAPADERSRSSDSPHPPPSARPRTRHERMFT